MDIKELKALKKGWNGDGGIAPNRLSIDNAEQIIELSKMEGVDVGYIQPSHNGGVNLIYVGSMKVNVAEQRWVKIECDNDGDIGVLLSDGSVFFILKEFITIKESIEKIKAWLKG